MKRKKNKTLCLQRQSETKERVSVDRGFPSLFAQTQANLFKNISFEASDDDFQETPLLRKDKNICTTLKAVKEDTSAPDPSNVVINEKAFIPTVNKDTSVQTFVTLIQEVVDHITQLVYADSIFANYYFLELLENGKHASHSIKKSFKTFCESISLNQSELDKYASKGYMTIVLSMAKQYETLVRNYLCSTYEDRTLRHILNVLSEKTSPYFCGDNLTVKQRKSLAKHIFQQKINPKSA
ncbi:hypothetical protein BCV71DRAFT_264665 [Rhizopus microsporus]|uniref:Uncharacterized protein n=1 Tax=Rhizopus microsporus TaxID=58291 RepID=A0A1X0S072_RHIZD|nr:hypothetical protein BCV71DRAFT_264665 [Rhizopus microsporus]